MKMIQMDSLSKLHFIILFNQEVLDKFEKVQTLSSCTISSIWHDGVKTPCTYSLIQSSHFRPHFSAALPRAKCVYSPGGKIILLCHQAKTSLPEECAHTHTLHTKQYVCVLACIHTPAAWFIKHRRLLQWALVSQGVCSFWHSTHN